MNNAAKNRFKRLGSRVSSLLRVYMNSHTDPRLIRELVDRLVPYDLGIPLRRVGGSADGGYLIPDDLDDLECCFSPGVADTASFEKELYDMGIRSYLADYSVAGPPAALPDCDFEKKIRRCSDCKQRDYIRRLGRGEVSSRKLSRFNSANGHRRRRI